MMADELYRAQRFDSREWVYWTNHGKLTTTQHGKLISGKIGFTDWAWELLTDDATQGRSVGKKDRRGKEIFGGDIVRHYNNPLTPEKYEIGVIKWDNNNFRWSLHNLREDRLYNIGAHCTYEVIGNIIDNPELMEV